MIKEISVKGFKTLVDVTIPFAPGITVMVGANNSGKSNVLHLLQVFASQASDFGRLPDEVLTRKGSGSVEMTARVTLDGKDVQFFQKQLLNIHPSQSIQALSEPKASLEAAAVDALRRIRVVDLVLRDLRAPSVPTRSVVLESSGKNLAAVLDVLSDERPSVFEEIQKTVRRAAPEVSRITTPVGGEGGAKTIGVEEVGGAVYRAAEISDGLVLFIGLATFIHMIDSGPPSLIAIEEPDRGIHPRRLRDFIDQLRTLTQHGTQVVITTHSPTLLSEFRDEPEAVLFFDRDAKGTHVTRLADKPEWMKELNEGGSLGALWYSGILGGVPSR